MIYNYYFVVLMKNIKCRNEASLIASNTLLINSEFQIAPAEINCF